MEFRVLIPARYHSKRLPGKPLIDIAGKPMIQHVHENAINSDAKSVVIATDDHRIADTADKFGAAVCMTSIEHKTGTDRIAEACTILQYDDDDIVVCLQGDEPLLPPEIIRQLAADLDKHDTVNVASIYEPVEAVEELFDPNIVKVVLNHRNNAMYFSRAPIPWERGVFDKKESEHINYTNHCRHVGLYAYRVSFLMDYLVWPDVPIENTEQLEQLRILWHDERIHMMSSAKRMPAGVDTESDLARVREYFNHKK